MEQQLSRTVRKGDAMQLISEDGTMIAEATFGYDRRGRPTMCLRSLVGGRVEFVKAAEAADRIDDRVPVR